MNKDNVYMKIEKYLNLFEMLCNVNRAKLNRNKNKRVFVIFFWGMPKLFFDCVFLFFQ